MIRLKKEQYAVGEAERGGLDITVGIFYEPADGEDIDALARYAQMIGQLALAGCGGNHMCSTGLVEETLETKYPGRPFYVETREKGRGVQVYQPYGMPQDGFKDDSDVSTGGCPSDSCGICGTRPESPN